jgi:hypothetical protein
MTAFDILVKLVYFAIFYSGVAVVICVACSINRDLGGEREYTVLWFMLDMCILSLALIVSAIALAGIIKQSGF